MEWDSARIKESEEHFTIEGSSSSSTADSTAGDSDEYLTIRSQKLDQNQLVGEPETPTFAIESVIGKETYLNENNFTLVNEEAENADNIFYCRDLMPARAGHFSTVTINADTDQAFSGSSKDTPCQGSLGVPTESKIMARIRRCPSSLKKILKWQVLNICTPAAVPDSAENKPQKESQFFGIKVHTGSSTVTQRSQKSHKNKSKNNTRSNPSYEESSDSNRKNHDKGQHYMCK